MICRDTQSVLPDLLLDPSSPAAIKAQAHVDSCAACRAELEELKATMTRLDDWKAPEPSPYFDQKLAVRLREEMAAPPAGWFERMRSRLLFNTGRQFRPAFAGVLAVALLVGGGAIVNVTGTGFKSGHQASATVDDLQIFDKNDQALQTMDQLMQDEASDDAPPVQPAS